LATITASTFASVDQREQPLDAGTVQVLRGLPAIHDDLVQIAATYDCHGADLGFLRFERDAKICLALCGNTNVADCFHRSHVSQAGVHIQRECRPEGRKNGLKLLINDQKTIDLRRAHR
jgi:hypothetical protein